MVKLNKLGLLCVVLALVVGGCGKKKCSSDVSNKNKKMAQANMPKETTENLLDESDISDFSFVDGEDKKAEGDSKDLVAEADEGDEAPATDQERAASAFKTVHFDFNKNNIRADQKTVVAHDAEIAKTAVEQGKKVVIEGHCDQIGSATYNLALSQRRAESVKGELLKQGVSEENIKTIGYGYEHPVVWSNQKNRAKLIKELALNRRAEVLAD